MTRTIITRAHLRSPYGPFRTTRIKKRRRRKNMIFIERRPKNNSEGIFWVIAAAKRQELTLGKSKRRRSRIGEG